MSIAVASGIYALIVLCIGLLASRRAARSPEDYFLAGRSLGALVLFMALFGTNATSFVLVGIPGRAYHEGIGMFGLNAPIIALGIPISFWAIGSPARRMASRLNAVSPAELYAKRFGSRFLGLLLFAFFTLYTLPYMAQALVGIGKTLAATSEGAIGEESGALVVVAVALCYTSFGGMLGTAWTNVFQGLVFLVFMLAAFFFMSHSMGGLEAAMEAVRARDADLLHLAEQPIFRPTNWTSWGFVIALTVIAFPHMLVRLMAAKDQSALRSVCRWYPLALALLWLPAVLIGVWGAAAVPGLEGRESDQILSRMVALHMPEGFEVLGFLAVLAAVMSTLDAMILTLGSMLVRDVLRPFGGGQVSEIRAGRAFGLAVAAAAYALSIFWGDSVFEISRWAFEGYVTLVPTLLLGVRWKRFTVAGAASSLVGSNALLIWGRVGGGANWLDFPPVFWSLILGGWIAVVVSRLTPGQDEEALRSAFG